MLALKLQGHIGFFYGSLNFLEGENMKNKQKPEIRFGEKLAFLGGNIGNIPIMTLINSFLLIFYTDVCKLDPISIGVLFLVTKILDGINDPIMGYVVDHVKYGKLGKFRAVLLFGVVACSLNFLLLWIGPAYAPTALKLVIAYISYILIGFTFDLMDIPLNSLIPAMTSDPKQRNALSFIKGAGYLVGGMVISIGAPLVIGNGADQRSRYTILIIAATAMVLILTILCVIGVKERIKPVNPEPYKFKDLFKILGLSPVMILFISSLLFSIGTSALSGSSTYFSTYILGDIRILSGAAGMSIIGMIPAMIFGPILANKISKRFIYGVGISVAGAAIMIRLLDVTSVPLLNLSYALTGLGTGVLMTVMYGIQADNVDYVEVRKGIRAEGAIASLSSFIIKAAQGIGGALPAFILGAVGYVADTPITDQIRSGLVFSAITLPGLLTLFAGLVFIIFYPINKKDLLDIESELKARRVATEVKEQ